MCDDVRPPHQHGFRQRRLREQTPKFPPDVCDDAHRCGSSVSGHGNAWTTRDTGAMRDETQRIFLVDGRLQTSRSLDVHHRLHLPRCLPDEGHIPSLAGATSL